MKRSTFIFFVFPLLLFSDQLSDFENLKQRIQTELVNIQNMNNAISRNANSAIQTLYNIDYNDPDWTFASGAIGYMNSILGNVNDSNQMISYTQSLVSSLTASNMVAGVDYTTILQNMLAKLNNIAGYMNHIDLCVDRLDIIIDILEEIGLDELLSLLREIRNHIRDKIVPVAEYMDDINGAFKSFYSNAVERISHPDDQVVIELNDMWRMTLYHVYDIVTNNTAYTLFDQLSSINENNRISNEGWILLNQLALQQRMYLCSVETLDFLKHNTNRNFETAWITNYLNTVQRPYYDLYNRIVRISGWNNLLYFTGDRLNTFTNFLYSSDTSQTTRHSRFLQYSRTETNWFSRIEMYLLALNGMYPESHLDSSTLDDRENVQRLLDYPTNYLNDASSSLLELTNNVVAVYNAFKGVAASFDLSSLSTGHAPILLLPAIEMGDIQIDHVYFQTGELTTLIDASRTVFTCIYYVIFAVILWFIFSRTFALFCKAIAAISSIIAKLIS